jgi:hypothetical protein
VNGHKDEQWRWWRGLVVKVYIQRYMTGTKKLYPKSSQRWHETSRARGEQRIVTASP